MITRDAQVLLLLCSYLGLGKRAELAPLTLREWNLLARRLQSKGLRPAALLEWNSADMERELGLPRVEAARLTALLDRHGVLAIVLERLASLGIHPLTRADADYPQRYRQRLKDAAPAVLFYAGEKALLGQRGIAVVGSRHVDLAGEEYAAFVGRACGLSGLVLYSGGARGVDTIGMEAALQAHGTAVAVLADSLVRAVRRYQVELARKDLCLVTPYLPDAGFSVRTAMGRNRLIYCLADYAIVVASDAETGGTWAGAIEALRNGWLPVFVLEYDGMAAGNRLLLQKGALPLPPLCPRPPSDLPDWLDQHVAVGITEPEQGRLFPLGPTTGS